VLNAPASFEPEIAALRGVTILRSLKPARALHFALAFVTQQQEVDRLVPALAKAAAGDAILWFAYPKQSSRKYKSEINRDRGWQGLRDLGFDTVRGIAIDEDWSALRFRRVQFIQTMIRASHNRPSEQAKTPQKTTHAS
jgi:hypothetical protein